MFEVNQRSPSGQIDTESNKNAYISPKFFFGGGGGEVGNTIFYIHSYLYKATSIT